VPSSPSPPPVIVVPTAGAVHQLRRTLDRAGVCSSGGAVVEDSAPRVLTREELYTLMHARLPNAPRRLSALERDTMAQAAAQAAASNLDPPDRSADAGGLPFRLRPGLVIETIRFYDQLRRQSQRVERFHELIE